jgi:hypothetical protein
VSELSRRWIARIPTFRETSMRLMMVASDLEGERLDDLAEALEEIAGLAEQADQRAREVLTALAPTLTDPSFDDRVEALRELAQLRGLFALARLLRRRSREGEWVVPDPSERGGMAPPKGGRALTLGERKSLARGQDRMMLDRLLRDPHPHVIRAVLKNPRITELDVVLLAARRPTYPDLQVEIAKSPRWSPRPRVRLALAQNPFTPPTIAVPLLPLLLRGELLQVAQATDLPRIVRAAAHDLLERRPPVPIPEEGTSQ